MARVVKLPADRQDEILDAAQRLFLVRGYDATPIQAILDEVGIAKGTFYHHYASKEALIEALIARMVRESLRLVAPIVDDPTLPARDKLVRVFDRIGSWKAARRELIVELNRAIRAPANVAMMARMSRASTLAMAPLLARVVGQGVAEGEFTTAYPLHAARYLLELGVLISQAIGDSLLGVGPPLATLGPDIDAFHDAVGRVLGARSGPIPLVDRARLEEWLAVDTRRSG